MSFNRVGDLIPLGLLTLNEVRANGWDDDDLDGSGDEGGARTHRSFIQDASRAQAPYLWSCAYCGGAEPHVGERGVVTVRCTRCGGPRSTKERA